MFTKKISVETDPTSAIPLAVSHSFSGPVGPSWVKLLAAPALENPAPIAWFGGIPMHDHSLTTNVLHRFQRIALQGHDCGKLIPHIQILAHPGNVLTILHVMFSSRKAMFAGYTVKANDKGLAGCGMFELPPTPMMTCMDPISLPTSTAINALNTVHFGMTFWEYLWGALRIIASIGLDLLFLRKGLKSGKKKWKETAPISPEDALRPARHAMRELRKEATKEVLDPSVGLKWACKSGAGLLFSALEDATTQKDVTYKLSVGTDMWEVSIEFSHHDGKRLKRTDEVAGGRAYKREQEVSMTDEGFSARSSRSSLDGKVKHESVYSSEDGAHTCAEVFGADYCLGK